MGLPVACPNHRSVSRKSASTKAENSIRVNKAQPNASYLAANSAFGPIYLGYSHGKHAQGRFYFFIGTP